MLKSYCKAQTQLLTKEDLCPIVSAFSSFLGAMVSDIFAPEPRWKGRSSKYLEFFFNLKFFFFFFLVLPVYCYQPISLHPRAHIHAQSCNPMDFSPPDSSVHGFFQARILEWVAISFSGIFFK